MEEVMAMENDLYYVIRKEKGIGGSRVLGGVFLRKVCIQVGALAKTSVGVSACKIRKLDTHVFVPTRCKSFLDNLRQTQKDGLYVFGRNLLLQN